MSLPKRDGVKGRYYLIHKPDTSPEVLAEADLCIQDMLNGTARENHSAYPTVVRNHNGTPFLPDQLLERYLTGLPLKEFPCDVAVSLCDAMRRLVGWEEIRYTLEKYIEKQVQERFFLVGERDDDFTVFPPCTVWPELRPEDVDEGLLRFACYVAVCHTVYGQSFESLTTEHILGLVSQLRPDMVKQLKTAGSGKLRRVTVEECVFPVILTDEVDAVLVLDDHLSQPAGALPDQMEKAADVAGFSGEGLCAAAEAVPDELEIVGGSPHISARRPFQHHPSDGFGIRRFQISLGQLHLLVQIVIGEFLTGEKLIQHIEVITGVQRQEAKLQKERHGSVFDTAEQIGQVAVEIVINLHASLLDRAAQCHCPAAAEHIDKPGIA